MKPNILRNCVMLISALAVCNVHTQSGQASQFTKMPQELFQAFGAGNMDKATNLINNNSEYVMTRDEDMQETPLHHAAKRGAEDLAQLIINQSNKLGKKDMVINAQNQDGHTPLHLSAYAGHPEVAEVLLQYNPDLNIKDNNGNTALEMAGKINPVMEEMTSKEVYNLIQEHQAKPKQQKKEQVDDEGTYSSSALVDVIDNDSLSESEKMDRVKEIIKKQPDLVNARKKVAGPDEGLTGLYAATGHEHLEIMKYLLNQGASHEQSRITNKPYETPLHLAAWKNNTKAMQLLIENGVDINVTDSNGNTPLHIAAKNGNQEAVQFLINNGAKVDIQSQQLSRTPLHWAASTSATEIAKTLVNNNANTQIQDDNNETPLDIAQRKGHKEIVKLLQKKK